MQRKSVLQLAPLDKLQLQCTCMYNSGQKETWDSSNFLGIQSPLAPCSVVKSAVRLCLSDFLSDQKDGFALPIHS